MERMEEKDGVGGGEGWSERRGESREQSEENEATRRRPRHYKLLSFIYPLYLELLPIRTTHTQSPQHTQLYHVLDILSHSTHLSHLASKAVHHLEQGVP